MEVASSGSDEPVQRTLLAEDSDVVTPQVMPRSSRSSAVACAQRCVCADRQMLARQKRAAACSWQEGGGTFRFMLHLRVEWNGRSGHCPETPAAAEQWPAGPGTRPPSTLRRADRDQPPHLPSPAPPTLSASGFGRQSGRHGVFDEPGTLSNKNLAFEVALSATDSFREPQQQQPPPIPEGGSEGGDVRKCPVQEPKTFMRPPSCR